jgi:hypothetical protein
MKHMDLGTHYTITNFTDWASNYGLEYEIARVYNNTTQRTATIVTFRGNYWNENMPLNRPRSNNEPFMRYVVAQAVLWPPSPGSGIVVDLSDLEYTSGDELLSWVSLLRWRLLRDQNYKIALVLGEKNKDAIKSLMEDSDETELFKASFDRLEDAISYICD